MPSASNAKLLIESGQILVDYTALTDSGDYIVSGGVVSAAASGSNDVVDITAMTVYLAGVSTSVRASTDD